MRRLWRIGMAGLLWLAIVGLMRKPVQAREGRQPGVLRLGMVESLFRDTPKAMIQILAQPIKVLLETQTGMTGQLEDSADCQVLAKQLQENQVDVAVFHGFEFAWARLKHPELQPLLVVSNPQRFQALLVVAQESKYATCDDLKGKTLALPRRCREHLHLYLERRCACGCKQAREFFSKINRPTDADDALDDVSEGMVHAALVDLAQWDAYRKSKPETFEKLRVLVKSENFPTGVIAYRAGALSDETVQRIRAGLMSAKESQQGRQLLKLCRMTGFELAPAEFNESLATFAKLYPPPQAK